MSPGRIVIEPLEVDSKSMQGMVSYVRGKIAESLASGIVERVAARTGCKPVAVLREVPVHARSPRRSIVGRGGEATAANAFCDCIVKTLYWLAKLHEVVPSCAALEEAGGITPRYILSLEKCDFENDVRECVEGGIDLGFRAPSSPLRVDHRLLVGAVAELCRLGLCLDEVSEKDKNLFDYIVLCEDGRVLLFEVKSSGRYEAEARKSFTRCMARVKPKRVKAYTMLVEIDVVVKPKRAIITEIV